MKFLVFGGGGKVARHFARIAGQQGHEVVSVIRDDSHASDLSSLSATPLILSLEDASVPTLTSTLTEVHPDAVVFSAGAGGKGGPSRTRAVDYEGALKVFDAMEASGIKRLIYVGAVDVRDRSKGYPEHYTEEDRKHSDETWKAIGTYMQAKLDAEIELHSRKALQYTVVRPGFLTLESAKGVEMGILRLRQTSRELVAQSILAFAQEPRTEGLTIDVMDGKGTIEGELKKVVEQRLDAWPVVGA